MHAPGVEVRPLRQMTGGSTFNEVFFTDVRACRTTTVSATSIRAGRWPSPRSMNERAAIGAGGAGVGGVLGGDRIVELLRHLGRNDDPLLRQHLADIYINGKVAGYTNQRAMAKIKAGQLPGPEMSIAKLSLTNNMSRVGELVSLALGPAPWPPTRASGGTYAWSELVLGTPGVKVAGGTDEVMKNIIGRARPRSSEGALTHQRLLTRHRRTGSSTSAPGRR